jgi:RNA-directed DNA polymerase
MRKYFVRRGGREWCFFGEKKDSGQREIVWLFHATSRPIRRHVKIKREADPYHPAWEMYFEARESKHMARTL